MWGIYYIFYSYFYNNLGQIRLSKSLCNPSCTRMIDKYTICLYFSTHTRIYKIARTGNQNCKSIEQMIGAGKMKQYTNVLDRPLSKGKQEVSLSGFAFLFSELVQYNQTQVDNIAELERRLEDAGYAVGTRILELLCHREKVGNIIVAHLNMICQNFFLAIIVSLSLCLYAA
ncbi:Hypothetical predicted protein [Olea europaea subsp. europaea]|uniref:Uncharacterized protein n=1 Tax=Olea europaea subsp. europaea TaxID=158383 RepID=A0A8S0UND5_OLEEU|nr:Hypothetical predicted protein [Olea europaea subsp. europaea]